MARKRARTDIEMSEDVHVWTPQVTGRIGDAWVEGPHVRMYGVRKHKEDSSS